MWPKRIRNKCIKNMAYLYQCVVEAEFENTIIF